MPFISRSMNHRMTIYAISVTFTVYFSSVSNLHCLQLRGVNHPMTIYGVSVIFAVYFSWHEPPYDHIWRDSNRSMIFVVLHTHLYGFHVIYPCIIAHEPPYQTYSSVGQASFCHRFPRTNDHTRLYVRVGLAPIIAHQYRQSLIALII